VGQRLDDCPLDTIAAKREWLPKAATEAWWVAFSHDVSRVAGRLGNDGRLTDSLPSPSGRGSG
jgi:hypothetical protein